jgi:hypothetical protein
LADPRDSDQKKNRLADWMSSEKEEAGGVVLRHKINRVFGTPAGFAVVPAESCL